MEYLNYYEDFTWLNESAKSDEYEREIKIKEMEESKYSLKPGSKKEKPF